VLSAYYLSSRTGTTLRREDLLHEALMSDGPVVDQVLAALAKLLEGAFH
jgi:hypothetical protein|tara:strand:+ start:297 stop:443 length:147 start_codon:yes stop_codon:yes gene_type:complete